MTHPHASLANAHSPLNCPPLETAVIRFIQEFSVDHVTPALRVMVSRVIRDQLSSQIGNSRLP